MIPLDQDFVRSEFPALRRPTVFLDNAGGTQILGSCVERVADYLLSTNVQHGATYSESLQAEGRVAQATADVAEWVGARSPRELIMGSSATQLLRNLSFSMAQQMKPGDEIIVTNCDHEANISPWLALQQHGVTLRWWSLDPRTQALRFADLEPLLTPRTRLVCFTHSTNVLGTIHDVADLTSRIHESGAQVCVDGVAYAPHRRLDLSVWGVDYYVFSLYKTFGPHLSVLYGKEEALSRLPNISLEFQGDLLPDKLQPGKASYELVWSSGAIVEYLEALGRRRGEGVHRREHLDNAFDAIARHEEAITDQLLTYLREVPGVRILGYPHAGRKDRLSIVSFVVEGMRSDAVPTALDSRGLALRYGDFYAARLIDDLGLRECAGVVRVSMVHYNTMDDIDRLIEELDRVLRSIP